MSRITIFYGDWVYAQCDRLRESERIELPDEVVIHIKDDAIMGKHWYRKDFTPILLEEVPKLLRAWALLLS